jgi:hypothetical protein
MYKPIGSGFTRKYIVSMNNSRGNTPAYFFT